MSAPAPSSPDRTVRRTVPGAPSSDILTEYTGATPCRGWWKGESTVGVCLGGPLYLACLEPETRVCPHPPLPDELERVPTHPPHAHISTWVAAIQPHSQDAGSKPRCPSASGSSTGVGSGASPPVAHLVVLGTAEEGGLGCLGSGAPAVDGRATSRPSLDVPAEASAPFHSAGATQTCWPPPQPTPLTGCCGRPEPRSPG